MKLKDALQSTLLVAAFAVSACSGESDQDYIGSATAECPALDQADANQTNPRTSTQNTKTESLPKQANT